MPRASRSRRWVAALLCPILAVASPVAPAQVQNLPDLGEESAGVLSPQMERRIGESYYRDLRRDPAYLDDPELKAYCEELGRRLIAAGPEPGLDVEFFLMRDATINAFAMLGGFVGINSGLLLAAQSESEAASVVAHELGHLTQRHIARSVSAAQRSSMASMVAMALALLAARSNSQAAAGAIAGAQAFQVQSQLAYSRDFEREADRVGFDTLQKAGFDVTAMPSFFERLQRAGRAYDSNAPVYVRSHPLTTERIADVRNRAQAVRYRQHVDSLGFHLVRAKLRATAETGVDGVRDALRHFGTQLAERTYASEPAARYGLAQAQLMARDHAAAARTLAQIPREAAHPMIDALTARVKAAAGDQAGAIAIYRGALARNPGVRYLELALVDALQSAGRHAEALDLLAVQARSHRGDPRVFELQAKSFAATGRTLAQHQALGEYYTLTAGPQAALEQFQIARCAGGDFYQQSILDARIRQTWERVLAERADRGETKDGAGRAPAERSAPPPVRCP
ncbi:MAG: M48 family metallopeptidase [Burkholderiales bacterium]|nr:M48 family metallopeptidase [Burkholderiales bacterium]